MVAIGIVNIGLAFAAVYLFVSSAWQGTECERDRRIQLGAGCVVAALVIGIIAWAIKG